MLASCHTAAPCIGFTAFSQTCCGTKYSPSFSHDEMNRWHRPAWHRTDAGGGSQLCPSEHSYGPAYVQLVQVKNSSARYWFSYFVLPHRHSLVLDKKKTAACTNVDLKIYTRVGGGLWRELFHAPISTCEYLVEVKGGQFCGFLPSKDVD